MLVFSIESKLLNVLLIAPGTIKRIEKNQLCNNSVGSLNFNSTKRLMICNLQAKSPCFILCGSHAVSKMPVRTDY